MNLLAMEKHGYVYPLGTLERCILAGDKRLINQLLKKREINIGPLNNHGDTILHLVFRSSELTREDDIIEVLKILITQDVNPNVKNNKQERPLHFAIKKWSKAIIDYLLQHRAKLNATDDQGNTVAHYFVKNVWKKFHKLKKADSTTSIEELTSKSAEFTQWMLEKGFDFDYPNDMGKSALHLAVKYNLQPILPALLKHTRDINFLSENGQTLLHLFLKASSAKKTQQGDSYSSVNHINKKFKGFVVAGPRIRSSVFSKPHGIEIVNILLESGLSIDHEDNDGNTALNLAIDFAKTKADMHIVKILSDRFTKFQSERGQSLLCQVIEDTDNDCYFKIAARLIAKGVTVNEKDKSGLTPLYCAFRNKNLRVIELLTENGANFGVTMNDGNNLLHALAENTPNVWSAHHQVKLFDLLMSQDCNVNQTNSRGETPLHVAVDNENIVVIRKLIANGADVHCRDHVKDWTPLHFAAANVKDSVEVAELLVASGAQINSKSLRDGSRPLHLAANISHSSILKLLLRCKAEVNARDSNGDSALVKALAVDGFANVKELLAHSADINDECVIRALPNYWRNSAGDLLLQHLTKLQAANLPCSRKHKVFLEKAAHQRLYGVCLQLKEVDKLKNIFIDNCMSLYEWLSMDPHRRYVNETLRNIVESETLVTQFPLYSNVILGHYRGTEARRALLEPAKEALMKLIRIYLPDICLERIFDYLNTGYLLELIEQ